MLEGGPRFAAGSAKPAACAGGVMTPEPGIMRDSTGVSAAADEEVDFMRRSAHGSSGFGANVLRRLTRLDGSAAAFMLPLGTARTAVEALGARLPPSRSGDVAQKSALSRGLACSPEPGPTLICSM